ncbi:MAG: ABC transporter ATP-binding protein [Mycobacteriales bacterium]
MSDPLLEVRGLEVAYGHVTAVRGVTLHVDRGEIVSLLGANGAGKTSTLRALSQVVRPRSGRVRFAGERLASSPNKAVAQGLAVVPEGRRVFPVLSVADNLQLGGWVRRRSPVRSEYEALVYDTFPRLAERRNQAAGSMSGGEQQMLAIGRALMSGPTLLAIDELSLGLAPLFVDELLERLLELNRQGVSLLLVEQFVHRALAVSNRVYVLSRGRIAYQGTAEEASRSDALENAYMARSD